MKLVLCPLAIEFDALKEALGAASGFHLAVGGHGKVQFALTAQHLIRELKPSLLVCAGACGSLSSAPRLTDVIAAEHTIEHDYNLKFIKRPLPSFAGDTASLEKLRGLPNIHFGTIASGDEDVIDAIRSQQIASLTGAIAVAWEGAGGAKAAAYCGVPFLELRTVTDSANQHAPQHFRQNIAAGMQNIATALRTLVD
jgi:adenosylhomocysteine nucleosidase